MGAKVKMTTNKALREKMQLHKIALWRLADELGITESTLCRRLRHELEGEEKEKIEGALKRVIAAAVIS